MKKEAVSELFEKSKKLLGKYKYALLVLLAGVLLMLWPKSGEKTKTAAEPVESTSESQAVQQMQQELERLLSQVEGAGKVQVMLSLQTGAESVYQQDEATTADSTERTTVLQSASGAQSPVVTKVRYPIFQGAVVVCQGADSAVVRLSIVNAVASLTGLGSDKITVIKMKNQQEE